MVKKRKYDSKAIKVFEGIEGCRARPSMYIGKLGAESVMHILREAVENSVDEVFAKENNYVCVKICKTGTQQTFIIVDKGRGIPVGIHEKTNISTLTTVLTQLHAGGKFDDNSYEFSRGVHGVGISVTNALSVVFNIWTCRGKKWYYQGFNEGVPLKDVSQVKFPKEFKGIADTKKGTIIEFIPDYTIHGKNAIIKDTKLLEWAYDIAYLNKNLEFRVITDDVDEIFINKGGPLEYLKEILNEEDVEVIGEPFIFESNNLTLALQWTDYQEEDRFTSYINSAYTEDGGTHITGLNDAITKAFRSLNVKGRKTASWTAQDIRHGIIGYINFKMSNAEFDSQTKNKLISPKARKLVSDQLVIPFTKFLNKHKALGRTLIQRANNIRKAKEQAKKAAKAASEVKKLLKKGILLPGKLTLADKKTPPEDRYLYLCEGDSAGAGAKKARNSITDEILCLRGKIINTAKATKAKILGNTEVQDIIAALGYDPSKEFYVEELRVGKIVILADADPDGVHIELLLTTLFDTLFPKLIESGKLYIAKAPLFVASGKNKKWYGNTRKEVSQKTGKNKVIITRLKGLAEMDWRDLKATAFYPKTRKHILIKPSYGEDKAYFDSIVGEDRETRKKLLGITV